MTEDYAVDLAAIAALVTKKCGVAVAAERKINGDETQFEIYFTDLHRHETIGARVVVEFRGIRSEIFFGPFAGTTISRLAMAEPGAMMRFAAHCGSLYASNVTVELRLDGTDSAVNEVIERRGKWSRIAWSLKSRPMVVPRDQESLSLLIAHWGALTLSLALDFLDLESASDPTFATREDTRYEGRELEFLARRYERDRIARELCIAHFGYTCVVCDLTLSELYGQIGKDFIHVHHKSPLSLTKSEVQVNPLRDLVPVCPNCHAMLHQRVPPFSVEELRQMLRRPIGGIDKRT